jgi:hypothetical protein
MILVEKPEEKKLLGRPEHSWVVEDKMNLREVGGSGMDWIDLAQNKDQWRLFLTQ